MTSTMIDLDAAIVAARVAGVSEREIAARLGCSVDEVRAAVARHAASRLAPDAVQATLIAGLERA